MIVFMNDFQDQHSRLTLISELPIWSIFCNALTMSFFFFFFFVVQVDLWLQPIYPQWSRISSALQWKLPEDKRDLRNLLAEGENNVIKYLPKSTRLVLICGLRLIMHFLFKLYIDISTAPITASTDVITKSFNVWKPKIVITVTAATACMTMITVIPYKINLDREVRRHSPS